MNNKLHEWLIKNGFHCDRYYTLQINDTLEFEYDMICRILIVYGKMKKTGESDFFEIHNVTTIGEIRNIMKILTSRNK